MLDKLTSPSTCLFVQATQPICRYVVVRKTAGQPELVNAGSFEHDERDTLVEHVRKQLTESNVVVSRAVLLFPRGDLEMNSLRLPPANKDELPELVSNMVAQLVDDAAMSNVHDFVVGQELEDGSHDVLTFTVSALRLDEWKQQFKRQNIKLSAVTFGGIGAVSLLNQVSNHPARTSVAVTTTDQDTDLAIVENGKPILFRTIPRATGDEQFVVDQLAGDIQRTLTLVGHPDDEEIRVYLIGTVEEQKDAAKSLSEKLGLSVSLVNPFDQLAGNAEVDKPSRFANLIGAACAWNDGKLEVDLLNPRRKPPEPSLVSRFGFWGAVVASLLAFGGYMSWEQATDERIALETQQTKLRQLIKPVKRSQSKQAIVAAVDAWRANDISWLDELQWLSEKLPPASKATVGTLTMSAGNGPRGQIDIPIVASEPSVRMELEKSIRDGRHTIRSKRVIDASNPSSSAWRFNSMIAVKAHAPLALKIPVRSQASSADVKVESGVTDE